MAWAKKASDYLKIFIVHMDKFRTLEKKRNEITAEMRRVQQMAKAALAMLPDEERAVMAERLKEWELPTEGLTDAIRSVLFNHFNQWRREGKRAVGNALLMTPVQIKEALEQSGYDFSAYKSNPLASIHAVLKRLEKKEVNTEKLPDGSTGYILSSNEFLQKYRNEKKTEG